MKKDKHKTKVVFLYAEWNDPDSTEIFSEIMAFFQDENHAYSDLTKTCYAHIGQHSACSVGYAKECRQATTEEYNDLKIELEQIGYNLKIVDKSKCPILK